MMTYEMFKEIVADRIMDYMPEEFKDRKITMSSVEKVNQQRDAISFMGCKEDETKISPNLYLDTLYEEYRHYEDIELVLAKGAEDMCRYFKEGVEMIENWDLKEIREHVIFQLINTEQNKEYLETLPHREYLDLSIIYRWIVDKEENGLVSAIITNQVAEAKGLSEDELFFYASNNTKELAPPTVKPMSIIIEELMTDETIPFDLQDAIEHGVELEEPMVVITNEMRHFGASAMLDNRILDAVTQLFQSPVYILPSSIHETIAIPTKDTSPEMLADMVHEINETQVDVSERLSNQVYHYDPEIRKLTMATDTPHKELTGHREDKLFEVTRGAVR